MKFLSRFEALAYALMRVVFGFLITCHGIQKLFGGLGGKSMIHVPLMLVAGIIEFGGGLLVAVGFQTRLAAFLVSGMLAVAYFTVHFPGGFFPIRNGGELAVAYCFAFLYIATRGAGKWGLDKSSS
jgi:putative oxidoreductase